MNTPTREERIYDGEGDSLLTVEKMSDQLILVPDTKPQGHQPDPTPRCRIMWGQHLLDDLLQGRYRTLVCAVNGDENAHGIISQLATMLPTSQWSAQNITDYASRFAARDQATVLKFDMDAVEVLGLLRPAQHEHLTLKDLSDGFGIVSEMIRRKTERLPVASVSFLGARVNRLLDDTGSEPSFETVLRAMHDAGFSGDVYPAPWMWESAPTALYARYPFPESLERMRDGGY